MADGLFGTSLRLPPANLEAEQALLGALLANNKAFDRVGSFLRPEHFADPVHGLVYGAIQRRCEAGRLADAVTLRAEFEHNGLLDEVGGPAYLAQLLSAMVGIINAGEYGRVVEDNWLRRQMIEAGEQLVNLSFGMEPVLDARQVLARHDEAVVQLGQAVAGGSAGGAVTGHEVAAALVARVQDTIARGGEMAGLTYGLRGLDRMTGGLVGGQLVTIGGKSSMGKTSMALRMATGAARAQARVLFVSAEMLSPDIMARIVCAEAGYPLSAYTRGGMERSDGSWMRLGEAEVARLALASAAIAGLPIMWDHHSRTVGAIRAQARKLQRAKGGGLDLVVVDYLTRLKAEVALDNRHLEITALVKGLKDLAMQLGVPLVLLSQLSRKVDGRDDKLPGLGDLRESGSIEEESDVVIFLHRDHYYLTRSKPGRGPRDSAESYQQRVLEWEEAVARSKGKATAFVAKQRQGPTGPVRLAWDDETAMFHDEGEGEPA